MRSPTSLVKKSDSVSYTLKSAGSPALGKVWFAAVWSNDGWLGLTFPEADRKNVVTRTVKRFPQAKAIGEKSAPRVVQKELKIVAEYLAGKKSDLGKIRLSLSHLPPFHRKVYEYARKVGVGKTQSYAEVANALGSPGAARAVGQSMARNPIPLIVPCHRVLASAHQIGGFTAPGGLKSKSALLEMEGYQAPAPTKFPKGDPDRILAKQCKRMAKLIAKHGPYKKLKPREESAYASLFRSILFQQLNGKAATTILNRVKARFGGVTPQPEALLATKMGTLRADGVSENKERALRDLAEKAQAGLIPPDDVLKKMSDEEIIERLTQVRGIGRWTVEMILIFHLGRPDVWPVDDFAIRAAAGKLFGLKNHPKPKEIARLADHWRPLRSVASWYLWRSLD
jgi:O-6-methylguanine DNA methyltransferase